MYIFIENAGLVSNSFFVNIVLETFPQRHNANNSIHFADWQHWIS